MEYPKPREDPYKDLGGPPPPGIAYSQMPPHPLRWQNPAWYDSVGGTRLEERDVFNPAKSTEERIELIKEIFDVIQDLEAEIEAALDEDLSWRILDESGRAGAVEVVRWLLFERDEKYGGPMSALASSGSADVPPSLSMYPACFEGHVDVVRCFVEEAEFEVNPRHKDDVSCLMRAALGANVEVVKYLLDHGAQHFASRAPDGENPKMATELDYAARAGSVEIFDLILESPMSSGGALQAREEAREKIRRTISGFTLKTAAQSGNPAVVSRVLQELDSFVESSRNTEAERKEWITDAVGYASKTETGTVAAGKLLLDRLLTRNEDGTYQPSPDEALAAAIESAICNAARRGLPDLLRLFATTLRDSLSSTTAGQPEQFMKTLNYEALARCSEDRCTDCAGVLIDEFGADLNAQDPGNVFVTILDTAVRQGGPDLVAFLLDKGADIHLGRGRFANGPTSLWIAASQFPSKVEALLEHGGPVESKDEAVIGDEVVKLVSERGYRAPVRLEKWHGGKQETGEDWRRFAFKKPISKEFFDTIQIRRSDDSLKIDGTNRPVMEPGWEFSEEAFFG